jgi:hypothetical protein
MTSDYVSILKIFRYIQPRHLRKINLDSTGLVPHVSPQILDEIRRSCLVKQPPRGSTYPRPNLVTTALRGPEHATPQAW